MFIGGCRQQVVDRVEDAPPAKALLTWSFGAKGVPRHDNVGKREIWEDIIEVREDT